MSSPIESTGGTETPTNEPVLLSEDMSVDLSDEVRDTVDVPAVDEPTVEREDGQESQVSLLQEGIRGSNWRPHVNSQAAHPNMWKYQKDKR
jgi:hypothetical protein